MSLLNRLTVIVGTVALISGCAFSYVDKEGMHHTIGLVKVSVPVLAAGEEAKGSYVDVTTLGLAGYRTPLLTGLSVGYNRERLMGLENNAFVTVGEMGCTARPMSFLGRDAR